MPGIVFDKEVQSSLKPTAFVAGLSVLFDDVPELCTNVMVCTWCMYM